jgi:Fic family protein
MNNTSQMMVNELMQREAQINEEIKKLKDTKKKLKLKIEQYKKKLNQKKKPGKQKGTLVKKLRYELYSGGELQGKYTTLKKICEITGMTLPTASNIMKNGDKIVRNKIYRNIQINKI